MNIYALIICMMLVTFIPRVLPAFVVERLKFGKKFGKFINLIPYTAMTALVFPAIFSLDGERWYVGVVGGAVAIIIACFKKIPSAVAVLAAVFSVMGLYLLV